MGYAQPYHFQPFILFRDEPWQAGRSCDLSFFETEIENYRAFIENSGRNMF
jgi:hypothetical protein